MDALPTRRLGSTDLYPTALALGGAWIGSEDDSDDDAINAVRRAFELGVNFFDTDASYMDGLGEHRMSVALRGLPRDEFYLSTKVGTRPGQEQDFSADAVRRSVHLSLMTLATDYLDLLLIHDPEDINAPLASGAALDEMVRMKEEGLVQAIGIGCREHTFHRKAIETGHIDAVITFKDYTLLNQSAAEDTIPLCRERGIGLILASVLDMGTLTGREPDAREHAAAHEMWQWAKDRGYSIRDLAIHFALELPIEGCVLIGPSTAAQVEEDIASAAKPIPDEVWQAFHERFGVSPRAGDRRTWS